MNLRTTVSLGIALVAAMGVAQTSFQGFVGKKLPQFVMKDLSGKKLTNKDLKGKVVILDFWASWCGPCKMASPGMQTLHKKYGSKGLLVIGANCMERGKSDAQVISYIKDYAKTHSFSYKFTAVNDGLAQSLGINAIPAFAIVDKQGVIRVVRNGVPPSGAPGIVADFEPVVKKLLASR